MASLKSLPARKWSPALLYGYVDVDVDVNVDVIRAEFGAAAEGQPPGLLRRILRLWVQDGDLFSEATDEF